MLVKVCCHRHSTGRSHSCKTEILTTSQQQITFHHIARMFSTVGWFSSTSRHGVYNCVHVLSGFCLQPLASHLLPSVNSFHMNLLLGQKTSPPSNLGWPRTESSKHISVRSRGTVSSYLKAHMIICALLCRGNWWHSAGMSTRARWVTWHIDFIDTMEVGRIRQWVSGRSYYSWLPADDLHTSIAAVWTWQYRWTAVGYNRWIVSDISIAKPDQSRQ